MLAISAIRFMCANLWTTIVDFLKSNPEERITARITLEQI